MNLLKSLATISSLTLVSRILALVRDVLIARIFGAGMATDAFFVAFKLPNLLRRGGIFPGVRAYLRRVQEPPRT
jgi:putative peptidoglycan lipid II flippase